MFRFFNVFELWISYMDVAKLCQMKFSSMDATAANNSAMAILLLTFWWLPVGIQAIYFAPKTWLNRFYVRTSYIHSLIYVYFIAMLLWYKRSGNAILCTKEHSSYRM